MSLTRPRITQFDTTATALRDPLTILNSGSAEANVDIGFIMNRSASVSNVALYWSESGNTFSVAFTGNSGVTNSNIYATSYANLRAGDGTFNSISTDGFTWTSNGEPVTLGGISTVSDTPPASPNAGDIWFNTTDDVWYVYQLTEGGLYWVDMYTQTLNGSLITSADISVNGNIVPAGNVVYNLGAPGARWKDLYLSGSTIDLNGAQISSTGTSIVLTNPAGGSFSVTGAESGKASASFGNVTVNSGVASTTVYTGALTVDGGVGVLGNINASNIYSNNIKFSNGSPYISALATSGVTAGNYGSATNIPTIVVDEYGRVTSVTSNAVSTTISLAGTSGTGSVAGGQTLTFSGSYGVTTTASSSTVTISTPQDLRTTASPTFAGGTFSGNLTVPGVSGQTIFYNSVYHNSLANQFGELAPVQPFAGNLLARPINLVSNTATIRIARPVGSGDPAVELLAVDYNTAGISNWWDFFVNGDMFNIRRRTSGAANIAFRGTQYSTYFPETNVIIQSSTISNSTTSGALQVSGGAGIAGNVFSGGYHYINPSSVTDVAGGTYGTAIAVPGNNWGIYSNIGQSGTYYFRQVIGRDSGNNIVIGHTNTGLHANVNLYSGTTGTFNIMNAVTSLPMMSISTPANTVVMSNTQNSVSTTTGALQVAGGVGVAKDLYVGGNVTIGPAAPVINRIWASSGNPLYGLIDSALTINTTTDVVNHRVGLAFGPANRVGAGIFSNNISATSGNEDANLEFYVTKEGNLNSTLAMTLGADALLTVNGNVIVNSTGSIQIPSGTTAQRPETPVTGMTRFNTTNNGLEVYGNSAWIVVGAKDGSSYASAADSATALYDLGMRGKGLYWIKKADGTPIQVYCDLDTLGQDGKGGWMLVASWSTASEWTKDSVSSSATFGSTALNCFSSNFGNSNMQHMRIKVSTAVDTAPASSEADWYFYWSSAIQWKTVWAAGSGTNNHYNSAGALNNGASTPRNSLRQFSYSYNLKFSYTGNTQTWNNLSDAGTSGSTGTEAWYDWYSGLTTAGYTLGVYNAGGAGRGDGTLAMIFGGDTSNAAGQDCNYQNAKYGYDDTALCAWGGTTGSNNLNGQTGTQGSNTNMWMWIK